MKSCSFYIHIVGRFLAVLSLFICCDAGAQKLDDKGRVLGIVRNSRNDLLVSATIYLENTAYSTITNVNGQFEFNVPAGTYTLSCSYTGLQPQTVSITVIKGDIVKQDIILEDKMVEGVIMKSTVKRQAGTLSSLYNIQKNNVAVSDGISIEQIRRTPDNNIGQSLRRINGVTVLDNKFVVVRGMGDRYNNILLNGSQLPSTETNRRNFSFDILPSNLVDNIIVNKTATPDLSAEFAGGLVQITTKEVPDKNTIFLSAGTGINTKSTGKDFYGTYRTNDAYLGKVERERRWFLRDWSPVADFYSTAQERRNGYSRIPNLWGLQVFTAQPIMDYQINIGLRRRFRNTSSLGIMAAASYRNEQTIEDYTQKSGGGDTATGRKYTFTTTIGGLLSLAYNFSSSKITLKNFYSRRLNHDNFIFSGITPSNISKQSYLSNIDMNDLLQHRLEGEHVITKQKIRVLWYVDRSAIDREQPDNRFMNYYNYTLNSPAYTVELEEPNKPSFGSIYSSLLDETRYGWGTDISVPFRAFGKEQKFKAGYSGTTRDVDFSSVYVRPTYSGDPGTKNDFFGLPDYEIYTPENFRNGDFRYARFITWQGNREDNFSGKQYLHAAYAMVDMGIGEKWRLTGGLRFEQFKLNTGTVFQNDSSGKPLTDTVLSFKSSKPFPSANLIYKLSLKTNLRLSYSETVARFDFREFSILNYYDFTVPARFYGNPKLKQTAIRNVDLRFEWYPTPSEIISVSVFYKRFTDPIESIITQDNPEQIPNIYVTNQQSSNNLGVEFDFRKSFGFLFKKSGFLKRLFLNGNLSVMRSNVIVDRNAIFKLSGSTNYDTLVKDDRNRPLQGLSPYSLNAGLLYDGESFGVNVAYNLFGKRLLIAGPEPYFDIYEHPRHVIDAQLFVRLFKKKMEVKLNVSDILRQPFIRYFNQDPDDTDQGLDRNRDFIYYEGKRGSNITLSASYRW